MGNPIEEGGIIDGTPLRDIKPNVPAFDAEYQDKEDWFAAVAPNARSIRSDERFR